MQYKNTDFHQRTRKYNKEIVRAEEYSNWNEEFSSLGGINNRLNDTEEYISNPKNRIIEISQSDIKNIFCCCCFK